VLLAQFFGSTALAVPAQFNHQGRLLDAEGVALDEELAITFRLMDAAEDGAAVWEEVLEVELTNGFYSAVLGADEAENPLDIEVLSQSPLWLEIQVDGETAMSPRYPVAAVPYATMAEVAVTLNGGLVNATEVAIGGTTVIDEDGTWIGPTPDIGWDDITDKPEGIGDDIDTTLSVEEVLAYVSGATLELGDGSTMAGALLATVDDLLTPTWEALTDIPDGLADGVDDDALASLSVTCVDGDVPHWSEAVSDWVCSGDQDTVLSDEAVEGYITDSAIDLAAGSTLAGEDISTGEHTSALSWAALTDIPDSFRDGTDDDTQLTAEEVIAIISSTVMDLASGTTLAGADISTGAHTTSLDWGALTGVPDGFRDGIDDDTQLSAFDVIEIITDGAIALAAGTTIGGADISTGAHTTTLGWADLSDIPEGFRDGTDDDTQLTEEAVLALISSSAIDFASGTTLGGDDIATGPGVPSGLIVMWSGSTPPDGWAICDGSFGTPNLRDRFVIGAGASYTTGNTGGSIGGVSYSTGSARHWGTSGLTVVTSVSGGGGLPPYYALAYIMKL
jgi:hypothetical protein